MCEQFWKMWMTLTGLRLETVRDLMKIWTEDWQKPSRAKAESL